MRTTLSASDAVWQHPLAQGLRTALQAFAADQRFVVACSGGRDSLVLADLMAEYCADRVRLLHVNHQLQVDANDWAQQVQAWSAARGVACTVCAVRVVDGNLEAAARHARYQAFAEQVQPDEVLVLAHHQQDQAETVLMRLFSGSGVLGLSAMRVLDQRDGLQLWRPLLGYSRQMIDQLAQLRGLCFVDDPANQSAQYDRVYLRQSVWPILQQRWPSVAHTVSRTADLMQDAAAILAEVIAQDLQACQSPDGLDVAAVRALSAPRQRQLLARWMQGEEIYAPPLHRVTAVQQLLVSGSDAQVLWQTWQFRCYQRQLYRLPLEHETVQPEAMVLQRLQLGQTIHLASGTWQVTPTSDGLPLAVLAESLSITPRVGGERLHLQGRVGHWPLKKFLQQLNLPVWQRDQVQLLYAPMTGEAPLAVLTPKGCFLTTRCLQQDQPSWRLQRV